MPPKQWQSPLTGVLTSYFGDRINPVLSVDELHDGIDIAADIGTNAVAVEDGTVMAVGLSPTYGNYVKYSVADGYSVLYAHLDEVLVSEGQALKRGQVVALTGNTGLTTGPHLHYTVLFNDEPVDPLALDFVTLDQ
jgi:murein DD-endopeptidase MepM/ murein hydrolase activator NlpD